MRGRGLVLSVIAHALALVVVGVWLASYVAEPSPDAPRAPAPLIEVTIAPLEVAFAPLPTAGTRSGVVPSAPIARSASAPRSTAPDIFDDSNYERPDQPSEPNPLAMRGLRHDLSLPDAVRDRIASRPAEPPEPAEPQRPWFIKGSREPASKLAPSGHGERKIDDAVVTMTEHRDGTVDLHGKKDIDIHIRGPWTILFHPVATAQELGRGLGEWYADPYADQRAGPMQDLPRHLTAVEGACQSWGDRMCDTGDTADETLLQRTRHEHAPLIGVELSGRFDVTGYLMRKTTGDPYSARKLRLLDETRDERVLRGTAYRQEQLDRSGELVQKNLEALWRTTGDPAARRVALFELWDECGEGEGATGEAGERARTRIVGWIRARLPANAAGAFTADEIARLDAKRSSRQHFVPYAPPEGTSHE